ncbi:hypothetical protein D3C73_1342490 [compost metagenome]
MFHFCGEALQDPHCEVQLVQANCRAEVTPVGEMVQRARCVEDIEVRLGFLSRKHRRRSPEALPHAT